MIYFIISIVYDILLINVKNNSKMYIWFGIMNLIVMAIYIIKYKY